MNEKLIKYVALNKSRISSVFTFVCSSGEKTVYIFLKDQDCIRPELVSEAWKADEGETEIYLLSTERSLEQTMRGCVGEFVNL